ncbi:Crp/Fnr family transcriptional regulator [Listeria booriae]|uniref:Crp/Fnr family transcriptional regulator n=1 Tax=Listeria booriae TaxID=1552123 RepID=UPI001627821F|nr:Crp/Fnr family transcriptional regulator [Listeria booriae]MBC1975165.1 Crp/Fnr family transcriptional regulator [Listeria booriae]MBC2032457.1 Crp/Fnr family transcriptional regulator [Listeria booriae]MBC2047638.1 Crp/Fnr family transcriptional regulator [Listeria booriae]MBC2068203.1 Crp/Fnr family transcriptional regulator [Listeria booriae]MBC2099565.1 Crp/Fnr family transcriptional regulator [Listeria booriae]
MSEKLNTVLAYLKEFPDYYQYVTKKAYTVNEKIILEEEKSKHIFFVVEGHAAVELEDKIRRTNYISIFIHPYNILGIDSFSTFPKKEHSITVMSDRLTLYKIDAEFLLNTLAVKPDVHDFLLTSIADIFARHYTLLGMIAKTPKERLYMAFQNLATEMGTAIKNEILLPSFITQAVLARYCRTTQPNISNLLTELVNEGFLSNRKSPYHINKDFLAI